MTSRPESRVNSADGSRTRHHDGAIADADEKDLSWFGYGIPSGLSADGKSVTMSEVGEGGGAHYTTYLRSADGSPAIRLSEGQSADISNDGKYGLSGSWATRRRYLLPTQNAPRELPMGAIGPGTVALLCRARTKFCLMGASRDTSRAFTCWIRIRAPCRKLSSPRACTGWPELQAMAIFCSGATKSADSHVYPIAAATQKPVERNATAGTDFGIASTTIVLCSCWTLGRAAAEA